GTCLGKSARTRLASSGRGTGLACEGSLQHPLWRSSWSAWLSPRIIQSPRERLQMIQTWWLKSLHKIMTSWLIWMNRSPGMKIPCGKKSRLCKLVVALSVFVLSCAAVQAQPQGQPHRPMGRPPTGAPHGPPSAPSIRERWQALPPEARQNFQRNAERWMRMSPEERNVMRQRENLRREKIQRETEAALRESGL